MLRSVSLDHVATTSGILVFQSQESSKIDLVLTLPRRLATLFAIFANLLVLEPPIALGEFDYIQVWHERRHHDPLHIWLRELIAAQSEHL